MSRIGRLTPALALALGLCQAIVLANGLPAPAKPERAAAGTPEAKAVEAYNRGLDNRNRGMKAEERAARSANDTERAANGQKAREEYRLAFRSFDEAARLNPALPHAWNGLGFAHRKLGEYEQSLAAYERALALAPNFPDALEYRGETYLAMNRIEDAKQAYLTVFAIDRKQADLLLKAMSAWVAERKAAPAGVARGVVSGLETWIAERAAIAQQTRLMGHDGVHRSW